MCYLIGVVYVFFSVSVLLIFIFFLIIILFGFINFFIGGDVLGSLVVFVIDGLVVGRGCFVGDFVVDRLFVLIFSFL